MEYKLAETARVDFRGEYEHSLHLVEAALVSKAILGDVTK
jgi:hypothetical protein